MPTGFSWSEIGVDPADRPFQERPVLGKVRPMRSLGTAVKVDLGPPLTRHGGPDAARVSFPADAGAPGARKESERPWG